MRKDNSSNRRPKNFKLKLPTGPQRFRLTPSPFVLNDYVPNQFVFTDVTGQAISSIITSAPVIPVGFNFPTSISVSGDAGASYSINGGAFVSTPGTFLPGQSVTAQVTSSGAELTATNCTVTIGGVSDTFSVTTLASLAMQNLWTQGSLIGALGGTWTYTRATASNFTDFEGKIRNISSNEARFENFRRVNNLVAGNSNNLTNASWANDIAGTGVAPTKTANFALAPDGSMTASRLQTSVGTGATSNDRSGVGQNSIVLSSVANHVVSIWYKSNTGADQKISLQPSITVSDRVNVTATAVWQRFSTRGTAGSVRLRAVQMGDWKTADTADILVWGAQSEDVIGQSNANPSELVGVGVLATPWYGAGIDGVKYFTTLNGNTVASGLVTEVVGASLNLSAAGIKPCTAVTNIALQSENHSITWFAQGTPTRTGGNKIIGVVNLDLIGDDDAAGLEGYIQSIAFTANASKSVSVFFSQGTSTSSVIQLLDTTATATLLLAAITWSGATPVITMTTGTQEGPVESYTTNDGVTAFRVKFLTTAVTAANTNTLRIYPATDAALSVGNTGDINIGGWQVQNKLYAGPYTKTTSANVTVNEDSVTLTGAVYINATEGTLYTQAAGTNNTSTATILSLDNNGAADAIKLNHAASNAAAYDVITSGIAQVAQISAATTWTIGTIKKLAARHKLNNSNHSFDGVAGINDAGCSVPPKNTFRLGLTTANTALNAVIQDSRYYTVAYNDASLNTLTT